MPPKAKDAQLAADTTAQATAAPDPAPPALPPAATPGPVPPPPRPGPGRILHYRYKEGDGVNHAVVGDYRPAMVVRVWPSAFDGEDGFNLVVFADGVNDFGDGRLTHHALTVRMGDGNGEACWPPRA